MIDCTLTITPVTWDDPDAVRLREAQRTELDARYGSDDHEPGAVPTAETVAVFLLARDAGGTAVGCGGLRLLGPGSGEIKRMYVEPAARGTGVAAALLRALEDHARRLGIPRLLLETGAWQPDAIRFYQREGYEPIEAYGPYRGEPLSRCFARDL
ncbi:GCN5-related N-acetyltransferase [Amycolatopsis mediterranei S699]|uniref:GCN5-related N-acetyltransferase n=2 Tax=Amycolatopsis mediterranei TaxID=33910 RepID=A0A0H3DF80_AMYMU|nr:GNAT family N-acetyltransferase [Amycolatopsis mediterranei]ADJ49361.1 GCN5-related N-acetyltransferase [Amycolatopsis mediterranei U32]AEK46331.1 GCN5-related N-acetyltransferase [Amycolatopsis mediterranei S699]AFO81069.1 GCN5-related N-acetyltransferase [Amycolatopsis mediterranei S699]AGT88197.1 GCN5-related N-acetyltransferase [Amycolatopsis mediterranei RB]UZF74375.1 GNAT family N-acetyltransferase [Amycolatopsis mediterranei]